MILKSHKWESLWKPGAHIGDWVVRVSITLSPSEISVSGWHRNRQSVVAVSSIVSSINAHSLFSDGNSFSAIFSTYMVMNCSQLIPVPEIQISSDAAVFGMYSMEDWKRFRPSPNKWMHVAALRSIRASLVSRRRASWWGAIEGGTMQ